MFSGGLFAADPKLGWSFTIAAELHSDGHDGYNHRSRCLSVAQAPGIEPGLARAEPLLASAFLSKHAHAVVRVLAGAGMGSGFRADHGRRFTRRLMNRFEAGSLSDPSDFVSPTANDQVDLPAVVGRNLRRLRTRRGHSLERLAKQSGVSRAMLGQIETGKSVPTIAVLWKVANALNVPFAQLLQTDTPRGAVVLRRTDAKLLSSNDGQFTSRALFPFEGGRRVEFYELKIGPLHRERAEPHAAGTRENLFLAKGAVEITVGSEKPMTLTEGDAILFNADVSHVYKNLIATEAVLYLVMTYVEDVG